MSDREISPASKTSDVHRLVMRDLWCDPRCPHLQTGKGVSGICKLNGADLDFYDWYLADCVKGENCDHDWELISDKKKICTYPDCGKIADA